MRRLWRWLRHRRPSPEACAARRAAEASAQQAEGELEEAVARRLEADQIAAKLRAHNTANRYDDLLRRVIAER